ncbi:response regulator [Puniceibacterium sediminis]|uniref:Response regulator receiver domain-containing protein n=1 Tax=Puniceibacterium sediminis TaxID=1608407 RepID=A0A238X155_9RHOB|nr:response regulator [Puniceibacterium sediminis]SNR52665.1 Response regulator receiver domain-containing protein [Puniceibacterium sediminis]
MQSASMKCLIVDDSETDRLMMERVLHKQSMKLDLRVAKTLTEARSLMREEGIRLVFLDNTLPDGIGANFLKEMKDYRQRNDVTVILVSDWPSPFMFAKARAQNVRAIWNKRDFTIEAVRRVLRERVAADAMDYAH